MASAKSFSVRSATAGDSAAITELKEAGFGFRFGGDEREFQGKVFPVERALVAVDDGRVVGHTVDVTMTVTVPGERAVRACGVAGVAVAPTHRRRGILRELYRAQHERTEAQGLPLTIFTASEATIYGRFGYEVTVVDTSVSIDTRRVEFRSTTPDPGGVTLETLSDAAPRIREIYQRWQQVTPAAQERPEAKWDMFFADIERHRQGTTSLFVLLHADGYALYRRSSRDGRGVASVWEFRAVTSDAHAALWRVLLGLDLVDIVEAPMVEDDPLPYMLTDPRAVQLTNRGDALWARIMDIPAALTARTYRADLDTVIAVHDPFRDAGGTFALRIRDGIADCEPTTREPALACDINVLGGIYFGGLRANTFAAANRLRVDDPAVLPAFDYAFTADRSPELGWFF
ncbi:GNAT family N-acetyltransferase [Nocardia sp. NPDC058640]|uniref:GNAT family N-acetyltransferase n=1 Tax=Nocardia sp. NPDC058640 TaxID=3346571 RepID=UPI00364E8C6C